MQRKLQALLKLLKPISQSLLKKKKNHSISTVIQTHLINKEKQ